MSIHATCEDSKKGIPLCLAMGDCLTASPEHWKQVTCRPCLMKMSEPSTANALFNATLSTAAEKYHQYWVDRFTKEGIRFTLAVGLLNSKAVFNGYELQLITCPSRFEGARIMIEIQNASVPNHYRRWREVKVKSESGFKRLVSRLTSGWYKI